MRPPMLPTLTVATAAILLAPLMTQSYGGGAKATNGEYVKLDLRSWIPGTSTALAFSNAPATTISHIVIVSSATTSVKIPGFNGTLVADITGGRGFFAFTGSTVPVGVPSNLAGSSVFLQGCVIDQNGQAYFTDAEKIDFFTPFVMVGNSRQSSNSIQLIDLPTRSVTQKLTDSELGGITYSHDRKWAYVCEPGSLRDRVVAYDLTGATVTAKSYIAVSPGIRYKCAANRAGTRLYVPISTGISVVDTVPTSATFHQEIQVIPTPITGGSTAIFTGPMAVALGLADTKLYIAYGEALNFPAKATVGVIDLLLPNTPHRAIPVNNGGTFFGWATRMDIVASPDGGFVYVLEWGVQPIPNFTMGYTNGGLLNIVDTASDTEIQTIATNGYYAEELCADRLGRNVWIAQLDAQSFGDLLRIDVDPRSNNRFSIRRTIRIGTGAYAASSSGPRGVGTTPDGSTVCLSVVEGTGQQFPELLTLDAVTETLVGTPVRVESLPHTVAISQY